MLLILCSEDCGRQFAQLVTYRCHRRLHTGRKNYSVHSFSQCRSGRIDSTYAFKLHLIDDLILINFFFLTGETPYACTHKDCPRRFRHKNSLRRHLQAHSGLRPFQCEICAKPLSHSSTLAKHMRKHEKQRAEKT